MSNLKVNVLLASFNGMAYIHEQLMSIINQSNVDVRITVSDDLSSDGTLQFLDQMRELYDQITVLDIQKQGGASANFFRLLRDADIADADYVALSDQDDIWAANKIALAIDKIQEKQVDAYSGNVIAFWPDGKQQVIYKAQPQKKWDYMFESAGPGCTFVLTKKLALHMQEFLINNKEVCEKIALHDWFIYAYARSNGFAWFIDKEPHMFYRQHAENVVGTNTGFKAKLSRWEMLRDGWLRRQALLVAKILNYEDDWPIVRFQRYHFVDRLVLIANITKLRRRWRDCVALAFFLLLPFKK